MAIQFPPINFGDPEPQDGDTFLYVITQQEFKCRRSSESEAAQWSATGTINPTSFGYRGTLNITSTAPSDAQQGNIYSVMDGGTASVYYPGLADTEVPQWSLVIFNEPDWVLLNSEFIPNSPWIRTFNGKIEPAIKTDNLDMADGNYLINELPDL
jgi:hypothetical protein